MDELLVDYRLVPGFTAYRVGSDGSVWSRSRNTKKEDVDGEWHYISGGVDKDGYRKTILCDSGSRKYVRVHVIVLLAFSGPPPEGLSNPTAAHNNGIKDDNRISNLRWASQKENIADKKLHGTHQAGEKAGNVVLTEKSVTEMRALRNDGWNLKHLAARFSVSVSTVHAVCSRRLWKNI